MKHLKVGDIVGAIFLGSSCECEVIEITDKKNKPWHILKYLGHKEPKVMEKDSIQKADLDKAIAKQKKFLRGEIKD